MVPMTDANRENEGFMIVLKVEADFWPAGEVRAEGWESNETGRNDRGQQGCTE
jgi:hypothetical protein